MASEEAMAQVTEAMRRRAGRSEITFNDPEALCSLPGNGMYNAFVIYFINPYFSGSMNDLTGVQQDSDMRDAAFFIIKKSKVAAVGLL